MEQDGSVAVAWAKSPKRISLIDHSIDVAAVSLALLRLSTVRHRLAALAGRPLTDVDLARLCFFVGLHDAGKVNHGFQAKLRNDKPYAGHIGPLWAILGRKRLSRADRTIRGEVRRALTAARWRSWFKDREDAESELWGVILAHHGSLSPVDTARPEPHLWYPLNGFDPIASLTDLVEIVAEMFPHAFVDDHEPLPSQTRFQHALAGFVTLADWLGSDEKVFCSPDDGVPSGEERIRWAREKALDLVSRRWIDPNRARTRASQCDLAFGALFPRLPNPTPRPAQAALLELPLPRPGQVTVLEAETGSGKTEAALIHFLRLFRAGEVDGLYFALPTRAAAVQIHRRIKDIFSDWLGEAAPPVGLAVPGYLTVDDIKGQRLPDSHRVLWPDDDVSDRAWAVENAKRYLSGTVMIGTIDQLLMGGLRVRHAPLRSGPMLRLLLCVDEVHASDAYMAELLRNVLEQHTEAGGHALLMSATLGSLARMRLLGGRVEAHRAPDLSTAASLSYPSLQRTGEELRKLPQYDKDSRGKRVTVELLDPEIDHVSLMVRLKKAADSGATVLFIRNRVDDARKTFLRLEEIGAPLLRCQGVQVPHHSRFAPEDRRLLDEALEQAFHKRDGIVAVTTQTAEQSLDIDADWLVTDIAPGDVLLQRIGRLHRHERDRPTGFGTPHITVLAPTAEQFAGTLNTRGSIARGGTILGIGSVYENIIGVLATRAWLDKHGEIRVPADNRAVVEAATHRDGLDKLAMELGGAWPAHLLDVQGKTMANAGTAKGVAVDWEEPLIDNQPIPDSRAETRLGLKDRCVDLEATLPGPFGKTVRMLNVPGWMVEEEDAVVAEVTAREGEIRFRLGSKTFRYDRLGLSVE